MGLQNQWEWVNSADVTLASDDNENVIAKIVGEYGEYVDNDSDSESGRLVIDTWDEMWYV